jgi:hypothetical protein
MFRKALFLAFMLCMVTQSTIAWGENYNFRYTNWGMSQEEVIGSEEKIDPVEKTENMVKYKTQILGKNVELIYLFAQNKLIGSSYKLDENYLASQHFIRTYNKFKQALMEKYGRPDKETTNWLNNTYRTDRKKWGLALSLGHTKYASLWNTKDTTIESSLQAENYYVLCAVEYKSADYLHLFDVINKEDQVDPF